MHFGASLRMLRQRDGRSLRELGAVVGVSPAYLSRVENGHDAPPTVDRLYAIARALQVPGDVLVGLAGRPSAELAEVSAAADALHREVVRRRLTPAQVARVLDFVDRSFPAAGAPRPGAVGPLLGAGRVLRGVRVARVEDAVDLAALRLSGTGDPALLADALRREGAGAWAVGGGLLLPHTSFGPPGAALVLLGAPLAAPTPDHRPVRAVLALGGVPAGPAGLALLGRAALLADPGLLDALAGAEDDASVLRLVAVFEG